MVNPEQRMNKIRSLDYLIAGEDIPLFFKPDPSLDQIEQAKDAAIYMTYPVTQGNAGHPVPQDLVVFNQTYFDLLLKSMNERDIERIVHQEILPVFGMRRTNNKTNHATLL